MTHVAVNTLTVDTEAPATPIAAENPQSPQSSPAAAVKPKAAAKRHQHVEKELVPFRDAMRFNYSKAAFNRQRDLIGCKSAKKETRLMWNCTYQSCINRVLFAAVLLAKNEGRSTITKEIVDHAYEIALASAPRRLYSLQ